jgi:hypothetical protein
LSEAQYDGAVGLSAAPDDGAVRLSRLKMMA